MATTMGGDYIQYPDGSQQKTKKQIVKSRYNSSPTTNVNLAVWGTETTVPDCQIDMGVPEKSNNWYRVEYYNTTDDWPGNGYGGSGMAIYRNTPSAGWERCYAQGQHAAYDNDSGDYYTTTMGLWYVPVHPTYPNEPHTFELRGTRHPGGGPSGNIRINCTIGADNRIGGWQNNMLSVHEIDGDMVVNTNITRF